MKASFFRENGGPEKLVYGDLPDPVPGPGEVLIRVKACALNHLDIWVREGRGVPIPMPHVSGSDVAGEVAAVGPGVKGVKPGAPALVAPGLSCGTCVACRSGRDSECDAFKILGFQVQGGYAELVAVPEANVLPFPAGLSPEEAAAVPLVFLTAYHMLFTRAGLRAGETVLVQAAGSGVGSAAVQLARVAGARVIVTAGDDAKLAKARELGADEGINYRTADFTAETLRLTGGRGADVVFEHVGGDNLVKSLAATAKGGRVVTCGATAGGQVPLDLKSFYYRQVALFGSLMGARWELLEVLKLVERKQVRPVVDSVFPLAKAADAQQRMLDRKNMGKIVLKI